MAKKKSVKKSRGQKREALTFPKRKVMTASVAQVRQPIYKTSVARWKAYEAELGPLHTVLEEFEL